VFPACSIYFWDKKMYSDNIEYARGRLKDTIVMYQGEPIWVELIDRDATVHFMYLEDRSGGFCHLDELDMVGQNKLGYINFGPSACHIVRKPLRHDWRQGLRLGNIAFSGPQGFYELPLAELRHTILGRYPTFQQAAEEVSRGVEKRAFSRNFAVQAGGVLLYKERQVGRFDKLVELSEQFKYLTESLNDIVGGHHAYD
jgi:hypothetical protein